MPFTPSHAAAVLPALRGSRTGGIRGRGPLVAAGLVAGSLAPDVPFFLDSVLPGCHRFGAVTHGAAGVLTVDPLLAAALVAGWSAVRDPVTGLLPPAVRDRALRAFGTVDPARDAGPTTAWFWASAVLGAGTHVVWDAFTHGGRWGVRRFPVLDREVAGLPLHRAAQYASSAAGLVVLGVWARERVRLSDERRALDGLSDERRPRTQGPAVGGPTVGGPTVGGPAVGSSDERLAAPALSPITPLTPRQRRAGTALLAACAVAGAVARYRRDRPAGLSGLIATVSFGAGGWLAAGAGVLAAGARARAAVRG